MRYRALDANGDMTWGGNSGNFLINRAEAVVQALQTRLKLWAGEWFLDVTAGVPYLTQVFGKHTQATADAAIKATILNTNGVTGIASYSSTLDHATRRYAVQASINTQFTGSQTVPIIFTLNWPLAAVTDSGEIVVVDTGQTVFASTPPAGSPVTISTVPIQ